MNVSTRLGALREYLRGSLWVLPTVSVVVAVISGAALGVVSFPAQSTVGRLLFGGSPEGARAVLQVIAGSVITVTSVTFSLTVVALQMAATQYSPRLLRNFLRDRGTQSVLSIFLATFAFSLILLRTVRSGVAGSEPFVPRLGVTVATLLALASVGALVYFIHNITQSIRVETILDAIGHDTLSSMENNLEPARGDHDDGDDPGPEPENALELQARRSGYVQAIETDALLEFLGEHDWTVRYRTTVGDHVPVGGTLAVAWGAGGAPLAHLDPKDHDALRRHVNGAVQIGIEPTLQQDVRFGIRQLADIAVRAVSPSLNDPTTAVQTLAQLSVVLRALADRRLGTRILRGQDECGAAIVPFPTFAEYVDLAFGQTTHYGSGDVVVARAILEALGSVGDACTQPSRRQVVMAEIDRTLQTATGQLGMQADRLRVREDADRIRRDLTQPRA